VRAIFRNKRIDAARSERSRRALSLVGADGADVEVESDGVVAVSESALVELLAEIEAALDRVLEAEHPRALDRILPRAHAHARLLRAMGHGVPEIRAQLAGVLPRASEVSDAAISKWIERGLPLLARAIEVWRDEAAGERAELAERLLERVTMRRADVGKPRASRRKSAVDGDVSVAGAPGRRSRRRRWSMVQRLGARQQGGAGRTASGGPSVRRRTSDPSAGTHGRWR
jgi:hypothetical protein